MMTPTRNTTVKFSQNEAETILELENNWHSQLILSEEKKKKVFGTKHWHLMIILLNFQTKECYIYVILKTFQIA